MLTHLCLTVMVTSTSCDSEIHEVLGNRNISDEKFQAVVLDGLQHSRLVAKSHLRVTHGVAWSSHPLGEICKSRAQEQQQTKTRRLHSSRQLRLWPMTKQAP